MTTLWVANRCTHRSTVVWDTDITVYTATERISRSGNKGTAKWFLGGVGSQLREMRRNKGNELRQVRNSSPKCLTVKSPKTSLLLKENLGVQGKVRKKGVTKGGGLVYENQKTTISSSESLRCPSPSALNPEWKELDHWAPSNFAHFCHYSLVLSHLLTLFLTWCKQPLLLNPLVFCCFCSFFWESNDVFEKISVEYRIRGLGI